MTEPTSAHGKPRRRLAPSEKYELYVQVLTGQATQREAAACRAGDGAPDDAAARLPRTVRKWIAPEAANSARRREISMEDRG